MRFFALAVVTAALAVLAVAAPPQVTANDAGILVGDAHEVADLVDVPYDAAHDATLQNQTLHRRWGTVALGLGINGLNAGDVSNSREHYNRVSDAIGRLCPPDGVACIQDTTTFNVRVFTDNYSGPKIQKMQVSIVHAEWGGDKGLLRTAISAAYERSTWDERNCHTFTAYLAGKPVGHYKNCLTLDYAEVNVRDGYNMKVRFSGPKTPRSDWQFVCEGGRGYSNAFFNGEKPKYQKALRDENISMFTKCLDH